MVTKASAVAPDAERFDFTSAYVLRALHTPQRPGSQTPFAYNKTTFKDFSILRFGRVDNGTMEFSRRQSLPTVNVRPWSDV